MSDPPTTPHPRARVRLRNRVSPIWLVPIVAIGLVVYLVVRGLSTRGPEISITFATANGLSADQTQVKLRAVSLGTVEGVELAKDMTHVIVHVRMKREARPILTDHARFWVVRPRPTLAGIGVAIETLVSGTRIQVDPGPPGGRPRTDFQGLESPPAARVDEPGRTYRLEADRLGSIGPGTPITYRDVAVGEVLDYDLGDGTGPIAIRAFVRSPFDAFVRPGSRFWIASGITVTSGPSGLHAEVSSLQSLVSGGIAFAIAKGDDEPPSSQGATFRLYDDEAQAKAALYRRNVPCVSYFDGAIDGLGAGSPVEIFGVAVGSVVDARLAADADHPGRFVARVAYVLQPERLADATEARALERDAMRALVKDGLRVALESSSFLTGQKQLALEYAPRAPAAEAKDEGDALVLPSRSAGADDVARSVGAIASKLNRIPFERIGDDLDATLRSIRGTVGGPETREAVRSLVAALHDVQRLAKDADDGLGPALARLPAIAEQLEQAVRKANDALGPAGYGATSDFQRNLRQLVHQVEGTARSVRLLADFLDRHPEALIRGRGAGEP